MPEFRPIAISIIDFLGSFLPGCVWLLVIHEYGLMLSKHFATKSSLFAPILQVFDGSQTIGVTHYVVLAFLAGLLGFAVKSIAMPAAEWCSRPETWHHGGKEKRFPYKKQFEKRPYFMTIAESVKRRTGFALDSLPGYQPFSACKRILRESRSVLWEELEHSEAEARMLASLFLAIVASMLPVVASLSWQWILIWGVSSFTLGYSFRRAREREINYCYLNFLIAGRALGRPTPPGSEGSDHETPGSNE